MSALGLIILGVVLVIVGLFTHPVIFWIGVALAVIGGVLAITGRRTL